MLTRTEKQEIIRVISDELVSQAQKVLEDSTMLYEFKKIDVDGKFNLNVLQDLGSEGWKVVFSARDIGIKDRHFLILQRAKNNKDQLDTTPLQDADVEDSEEDDEEFDFGDEKPRAVMEDDL